MSRSSGKKYAAASKQVEARPHSLEEAVPLVQKIKFAKFDETVELHLRLGVDPKHADQMVRGTIVLPNGIGKSKKVLVIASGDKIREAEAAGADFFGGEEMVTKIQSENWTAYDAVVATPDMMRSVGRLGKVLGPRGLMPNPKTGTVTEDTAAAVLAPCACTVRTLAPMPINSTAEEATATTPARVRRRRVCAESDRPRGAAEVIACARESESCSPPVSLWPSFRIWGQTPTSSNAPSSSWPVCSARS